MQSTATECRLPPPVIRTINEEHFSTETPTTMKTAITAAFALILGIASLTAKDKDKAPRGYDPISELEAARSEAGGKKLIVVLVKGLDDACPNCAAAMENGERALGSGVVKVFARAETLNKADLSAYPAAFQERAKKKFTYGSAVTFLVFDPAMEKLIVEATRKELQSNKKLTAEFKKTVKEAKSEYK